MNKKLNKLNDVSMYKLIIQFGKPKTILNIYI